MNLEQQVAEHRGSHIYHSNDGYRFHLNRIHYGTSYYRCTEWRRGCPSTAKVTNEEFSYLCYPHSHPSDDGRADYQLARNDLVEQFTNLNVSNTREIFTNPRNQATLQQYPELTHHRLYPSMVRARVRALPRVQSLFELNYILQDPRFTSLTSTTDSDCLYRGSVQGQDESCILMISQKCQKFMELTPKLIIFSTVVPVLTHRYQIISVATEWDRNIIELAWLLTSNDISEASLVRAFAFLKSCLRSCRISKAICGSKIIGTAFSTSFTGVSVSHSLYDFIHWLKNTSQNSDNYSLHPILKLTSALPMLPKDLIQDGIVQIINEARRTGMLNDCLPTFNQIETCWLNNPEEFSVFGSHERTNYGIEDQKHKLQRHYSQNTDMYCLVRKIVTRGVKSHQKIQCALEGQQLEPKMPPSLTSDPQILNIVQNGLSSEIRAWSLLNIVSQKIPVILNLD